MSTVCLRPTSDPPLYDLDLFLRQPMQVIYQGVDPAVGRLDPALQRRLDVGRLLRRQPLVQVEPTSITRAVEDLSALSGLTLQS